MSGTATLSTRSVMAINPVAKGHEASDAVGPLPIGFDRRVLLVLDGHIALAHSAGSAR